MHAVDSREDVDEIGRLLTREILSGIVEDLTKKQVSMLGG